jgi:hypothetical protein
MGLHSRPSPFLPSRATSSTATVWSSSMCAAQVRASRPAGSTLAKTSGAPWRGHAGLRAGPQLVVYVVWVVMLGPGLEGLALRLPPRVLRVYVSFRVGTINAIVHCMLLNPGMYRLRTPTVFKHGDR